MSADLTSTVIGHWKPLVRAHAPAARSRARVRVRGDAQAPIASHVRLNIHPDGGVSRLRIFGVPTARRTTARGPALSRTASTIATSVACSRITPPHRQWIEKMAAARPYETAGCGDCRQRTRQPTGLGREDWLEAFRHHPRIGERTAERAQSAAAQTASASEQVSSGERTAAGQLDALAQANREYEARFGHVFIVSAEGKTADRDPLRSYAIG